MSLESLSALMKNQRTEYVFHLGAQSQVREAISNPDITFVKNIQGTWDILEAARKNNIRRIIIASTDKVYGRGFGKVETDPLNGTAPYDTSKIAVDKLAHAYLHTYNMNIAITRCANIFGGGDLNMDRLIPDVIIRILNNQRPMLRSNGSAIRDWLYIKDCVKAYESLALSDMVGAFNFSMEHPKTILNMVKNILKLMNSNFEPEILDIARNEISEQSLDCTKALICLKWQPEYNLEQGLKETIEWYTKWNTKLTS
jgi:CDP-glucose 4,6-dehydratase